MNNSFIGKTFRQMSHHKNKKAGHRIAVSGLYYRSLTP